MGRGHDGVEGVRCGKWMSVERDKGSGGLLPFGVSGVMWKKCPGSGDTAGAGWADAASVGGGAMLLSLFGGNRGRGEVPLLRQGTR